MAKIDVYNRPKQVQLAAHAIGLDNKDPYKRNRKLFYRPYRNYFVTTKDSTDYKLWMVMLMGEMASSSEREKRVTFHLTRKGLDWLGEQLGMTIYDEEA